jgi:hypothetical protein
MNYSGRNLTVCAYWYDRPLQGGEFLRQTRLFIEKILLAFPVLSTLKVVRDPKESSGIVDPHFSNFDLEVVAALPKDYVFINSDPQNKNFTKESFAATLFPASFVLSSDRNAGELSVRISAGTPHGRSSDQVIIEISPEFESVEIAKAILEISVEFWQPFCAFVGRTVVQRALNQPVGSVRIGWLTYLSDVSAQQYLPHDVRSERLFSGLLIYSSALPGFEDDIQGIEAMRKIIDRLSPHTFLKGHSRPVRHTA